MTITIDLTKAAQFQAGVATTTARINGWSYEHA